MDEGSPDGSGPEADAQGWYWRGSRSLAWLSFRPDAYDALLAQKVAATAASFGPDLLHGVTPSVFASPPTHYRQRVRFALRRFGDAGRLSYALFENGAPDVPVSSFPVASVEVNAVMGPLIDALNADDTLGAGAAAVHFLGTQAGDMLVTLLYGEPLRPGWREAAAS